MVPSQELLKNDTSDIRVSKNESYIILYIPSNITIKLEGDYTSKQMMYIDLENKEKMLPESIYLDDLNITRVSMHRFTRDALLIIKK